jgi:hypothetical protein
MTALATVEDREDLAQYFAEQVAPRLARPVQDRDEQGVADARAELLAPLSRLELEALCIVLVDAWPIPRHPLTRFEDGTFDEIAVGRVVGGERLPLTRAERDTAIHKMRRKGWLVQEIADHFAISKQLVSKVACHQAPVQTDLFDEEVDE